MVCYRVNLLSVTRARAFVEDLVTWLFIKKKSVLERLRLNWRPQESMGPFAFEFIGKQATRGSWCLDLPIPVALRSMP